MVGRSISSLFTARLIRAATAHGASAAALWRCAGVRPDGDEFPPIDEARHLAVWRLVMRRLDDPGFPIAYADSVSIDDYGLLGLACKTAPDVGAALAVIERHLGAYADTIQIRLERGRTEAAVVVARASIPDLGMRCATESTIAELLAGVRAICGHRVIPRAVTFAHGSPRDIAAHVAFFGVTPGFGAPGHTLVLGQAELRRPLVQADRALHEYLVRELGGLAAARVASGGASWSDRVRAELLRTLPRPPQLALAARALAVSTRTLQRHLKSEQTTFDRLLDQARRELASALLVDPRRSVLEVALATGFAETSSFARAFRRWTGRSPRSSRG